MHIYVFVGPSCDAQVSFLNLYMTNISQKQDAYDKANWTSTNIYSDSDHADVLSENNLSLVLKDVTLQAAAVFLC